MTLQKFYQRSYTMILTELSNAIKKLGENFVSLRLEVKKSVQCLFNIYFLLRYFCYTLAK